MKSSLTGTVLTMSIAFSISMNCYRNTTGTGVLSQILNTFVILRSKFYCQQSIYITITMSSDPFIHMERANKTYGFTIAVKELRETGKKTFSNFHPFPFDV